MKPIFLMIIVVVLSPYIVALVCGLVNGSFMKLRNLNAYVRSDAIQYFRTRQFIFSTISNTAFYVVFMSISIVVYMTLAFTESEINVYAIIFTIMSLPFLYFITFIFCEMQISGDSIYIYNVNTLFFVKRIPIDDVIAYSSGGIGSHSWINFKTKDTRYWFHGVSNDYEFVLVMNKLNGGAL